MSEATQQVEMPARRTTAGKDYEVFTKNSATGVESVVTVPDGTIHKIEGQNRFKTFRGAVDFVRQQAKQVRTNGSKVDVLKGGKYADWHDGYYGYTVTTPPPKEGDQPIVWTLETRPVERPVVAKPAPPAAPATTAPATPPATEPVEQAELVTA